MNSHHFPAVHLSNTALKELSFDYFFFGLHLRSQLPLPGIQPATLHSSKCDVALHMGIAPCAAGDEPVRTEELTYVSAETNTKGAPALRIWKVNQGAFVRMAYDDGTEFWIDSGKENIWAIWPDPLPLENATSYLLGPVLGLVLRLRGVICLHASAVTFGDHAIAFVGGTGAGKSTTAAALAQQGLAIISDDIVALEERYGILRALPAYPHICLWPDSVKLLYGSGEALPRVIRGWEKRQLVDGDLGTRFEKSPRPLGVIYALGDRRPDQAPFVEAVRPRTALLSLVADTYANKILDRELRAREFAFLGRLVATVPVRRIHPHTEASRIGELCRTIQEDVAHLNLS